jgi:hypothetical protein
MHLLLVLFSLNDPEVLNSESRISVLLSICLEAPPTHGSIMLLTHLADLQ